MLTSLSIWRYNRIVRSGIYLVQKVSIALRQLWKMYLVGKETMPAYSLGVFCWISERYIDSFFVYHRNWDLVISKSGDMKKTVKVELYQESLFLRLKWTVPRPSISAVFPFPTSTELEVLFEIEVWDINSDSSQVMRLLRPDSRNQLIDFYCVDSLEIQQTVSELSPSPFVTRLLLTSGSLCRFSSGCSFQNFSSKYPISCSVYIEDDHFPYVLMPSFQIS